MGDRNELVHQRNKLMLKLLTAFYVFDNLLNLLIYKEPLEKYTAMGIVFILVAIYFVWKRKYPVMNMYLMVTFVFTFIFSLIVSWPCLVNFIFIWAALVLISLYHDYYIIILSGVYAIAITIYSFYRCFDEIFLGSGPEDILFYIMFDIFLTIFLMFTTKFTKSLWLKAERSQQQLNHILDNVDVITWSFCMHSNKLRLSSSVEKISGVPASSFFQDKNLWKKIVYPDDLCRVNKEIRQLLLGKARAMEFRIIAANGEIRWIQNRGIPIKNERNRLVRLDGVVIDITKRKRMEEKIEYMAYYDSLTGLPNRALFDKNCISSINKAKKNKEQLAVIFMDLDGFKLVNDSLGHDMGDLLLKEVGKRLKSVLCEKDMICRIGGDEFIILLESISNHQVVSIAQKIINMFSEPFIIRDNKIYISVSIGISIYPKDGIDMEELIKKADDAMYVAKKSGKSNYRFHNLNI